MATVLFQMSTEELYSKLRVTRTAGEQKKCSRYTEFRVRRCFMNGESEEKVWESCTNFAIIRVILTLLYFDLFGAHKTKGPLIFE